MERYHRTVKRLRRLRERIRGWLDEIANVPADHDRWLR